MAGALKRADPNMNEEAILMRALRWGLGGILDKNYDSLPFYGSIFL